MTQNLILFISFTTLLFSCCNGDIVVDRNTDKKLITQLISKNQELAQDTIDEYKLIRSVIVGNKKVGVKLFSTKHEHNTPNSIIVISNSKGENYAIPFFSNNFKKYWNFENEKKTFDDKVYNSLFEKEFIEAINQLKLNDTLGTGRTVLYEIFHSLLHFQQITEHDEEYLEDLGRHFVSSDSNNDQEMESKRRNELNSEQILNDITKTEYVLNYNALLDQRNSRVFQIDFPKRAKEKIFKLNIKIYRFGQEVISLIM